MLAVASCSNIINRPGNHLLEFVRWNISQSFARLADGLMEDPPADSFLDKLGDSALFHALSAQVRAQGKVDLFGPSDRQSGGFIGRHTSGHINIDPTYQYRLL